MQIGHVGLVLIDDFQTLLRLREDPPLNLLTRLTRWIEVEDGQVSLPCRSDGLG